MSYFFEEKFKEMKIKKFYYYSPEKLKLVPIQNFLGKIISFLLLFTISIVLFTISITFKYFTSSESQLNDLHKLEIKKEYENEIAALNNKYVELAEKFDIVANQSNALRLAVNLEPLKISKDDYGIGGSIFEDIDESLLSFSDKKISHIYDNLAELEKELNFETSNHEQINNKYKENIDLFDKLPAIKPVNSPLGDRFGMRFHPILKRRRMHHGLDFLANTGEEVLAPGDGVVTYVGRRGGYGKIIRINHGYGYETIYGHLSKYKVKKGQKIKRGEIIALSGNSGSLSTGPHLHYEVRHNGICLNPRNFIFEETKLFEKHKPNILASR